MNGAELFSRLVLGQHMKLQRPICELGPVRALMPCPFCDLRTCDNAYWAPSRKLSHPEKEPTVPLVISGQTVDVDESIATIVAALNMSGLPTVASCSGHGHRPGNIALADGREIIIARNYEEARQIDALFPLDINGEEREMSFDKETLEAIAAVEAMDGTQEVLPPEELEKASARIREQIKADLELANHSPMQRLIAQINADPEYAWAVHCNITMPIHDAIGIPRTRANEASAAVMSMLFSYDITKHPNYEQAVRPNPVCRGAPARPPIDRDVA